MAPLYDKIVAADALIVGFPVYFGHANAFTDTFLERLLPAAPHPPRGTEGKRAAVVSVGGNEAEPAAAEIKNRRQSDFGERPAARSSLNSATPPCFIGGDGTARHRRPGPVDDPGRVRSLHRDKAGHVPEL